VGEQGHIDGAMNIPLEELSAHLNDISGYQQRPVFIVCRTDKRSAKAALLLAQHGFADVHIARGGMTDWIRNGYPVSRS
jgi:rhodanese-related sulfurtransferase